MKRIIYILLTMAWVAACNPITENETLGDVLADNDIQATVQGINPGSNCIILENKTPGVSVYWDYIVGASIRQKDTVLLPFLGVQEIKLTVMGGGGPVTKIIPVTIEQIDHPLDPMWGLLTNNGEGKTWVWATGNPHPNWDGRPGLFGNGATTDIFPEWWIVTAEDLNSASYGYILYDEMVFDLIGGANYTLIRKGQDGLAAPTEIKDQFILDASKKTIKTGNRTPFILDQDFIPSGAVYTIVELTEDEMTLIYTHQDAENYIWKFKCKGYEY